MKILTFDTALNKTYISLSEDLTLLEKMTIETNEDKYHSAFLIQEIANILKRQNLKMKDINAVGINIGPGSFTGIRACTTVGRIIAQQMDLPLVPVCSLEILSRINNEEKTIVTLDARKNSAYMGIYGDKKVISEPQIMTIEELVYISRSYDYIKICDTGMYNLLNNEGISNIINYEAENYPLNEYLMNITCEKLINSKTPKEDFNWAKVKPLYIQPPSIFGATNKK